MFAAKSVRNGLIAGAMFFGVLGGAAAASVTCGNAGVGPRTVTVNPALVGGLCFAMNGNLQDADITTLGLNTVDKDVTTDFPSTGDNSEGALQFTRTTITSGNWTFSNSLWNTWSTLYLAMHYGGGQAGAAPDSFVVQLDPAAGGTGTYALNGEQNGLSNIYLLGVRCTTPGGCAPGADVPVSEPGALMLLAIGLIGLGLGRKQLARKL